MNTFSTTRLRTLMLREWMQHHRGWLAVMLALPLLVGLLLPFGDVNIDGGTSPARLAGAVLLASAAVVCGLSWAVMMLQLPGLARRDQQDRSIEFWLSLPASHSESIAATLLMHVLALPLLAMCVGAALGLPFGAAFVVKVYGASGLADVPWIGLVLTAVIGLLRAAFGLLLLSLWLAPMYLSAMAASAWLGRWGAPALIGIVLIGGLVLRKLYDNTLVFDLLREQLSAAPQAILNDKESLGRFAHDMAGTSIGDVARWALGDLAQAVSAALGSAQFLGGLLVAAACFGLLVMQRRRSI